MRSNRSSVGIRLSSFTIIPLPLERWRDSVRKILSVAERFEIYIAGIELANAFSELTDAGEQRARFARERKDRGMRGKVIYPEAEKFLECLKFLPDSAGIALGIDRLCMIFSGETTIDRVVAFTMEEL